MEFFLENILTIDGDACAVVLMESLGSDATIWRSARVCKGGGFCPEIPEPDVLASKIAALWKAKHRRPFDVPRIVFGVRVPLWLADHLRVYSAPFTSRTFRFCAPLEHYVPSHQLTDADGNPPSAALLAKNQSLKEYEDLRRQGVAPEDARKVLTQNVLTETVLPFTLRQFFRVCDERISGDAQNGTRRVVETMLELAAAAFPAAVAAYKWERK